MSVDSPSEAGAIVFAVTVISPAGAEVGGAIAVKHLVRATHCNNQVLAGTHRYRTFPSRSKVECLSHCRPDVSCVSIVYDADSKLCHLGDATAYRNCSNMEPAASGVVFYQEPPPCGVGEVSGPTGLCICAPGFTGSPCTRYLHDCTDVKSYGDWSGDGLYTIRPLLAPQPFQVFCRHISLTRTYILDRRKNSENFNRSWLDYRQGFGDLTSDHWIGLENIYALTADRSYEMRVNLKVQNATTYLLSYKDFKVLDESTGYRLYFNASLPNGAQDCLLPLLNVGFSTYDHDRDEDNGINCADVRKGGFWFRGSGCNTCNPSGILYQPTDGRRLGTEDEAFWDSVLGNVALFKISMYLLPLNP